VLTDNITTLLLEPNEPIYKKLCGSSVPLTPSGSIDGLPTLFHNQNVTMKGEML
jgi:hypothetical protein